MWSVEQLGDRGLGLLESSQVEPDQCRVRLDALVRELFEVSLVSLGRRRDRVRVAQVGDPAMALRDQVLDATPHPGGVVGHHRIRVQ